MFPVGGVTGGLIGIVAPGPPAYVGEVVAMDPGKMGMTSASANAEPIARATLIRMGGTSARRVSVPSAMRHNDGGGPMPVDVVAEGLATEVGRKFILHPGDHAEPLSGFEGRGDGGEIA